MRKRLCLLVFYLSFHLSVFPITGYAFFNQRDKVAIRESAQTDWGKLIIDKLENIVTERRNHDLKVPLLEGGHLHDYFCPVHNQMFIFDWDSPNAHFCQSCGKKHEGNKRVDWAWINRLHEENLKYIEACMYLYLAKGDKVYARYITDMMLDYAYKYPTYFEHNTNRVATALNSGKLFGQSLDESVWASTAAKVVTVAKDEMTADEYKKIKDGYLVPCSQLLLKRRGGGNWQVWHNSGLIALGVALGDDQIIDVALNDPQCGYHQLMKVHVHDDGWWNEGSPIYHYYPLRAMLLSAEALRDAGINLYDDKLENMLASPALGVYADLTFPAHNDGWYGESLTAQVRLYELAAIRYQNPFFRQILENCYDKTERLDPEALLNPVVISPKKNFWGDKGVVFNDLGVAVLRYKSTSLVLKYGPYGGGHGHPDKLSISLHDGEKEILSDLGTSAYGVPDFTRWYRKTLPHSTVSVDFRDQLPITGKLIDFKPSGKGGYVEAEVDGVAEGVKMTRKIKLEKNKFSDVFSCSSDEEHVYDYVLIFTSKPFIHKATSSPTKLHDAPVYELISKVERHIVPNKFNCFVDGAEISFSIPKGSNYEIFTGEATGIPPTNPSLKTSDDSHSRPAQHCYPLIIRVKGKSTVITANWKLNL